MSVEEAAVSRRWMLGAVAGGAVGWNKRSEIMETVHPPTFKIQGASVGGTKVAPGDSYYVFAFIKNNSNRTATARGELHVNFNEHTTFMEDQTFAYSVKPGDWALLEFLVPVAVKHPTHTVTPEIRVFKLRNALADDTSHLAPDSESLSEWSEDDRTRGLPPIEIRHDYEPIDTWGSRAQWTQRNGFEFGEYGQIYGVRDADSMPYLIGWLQGQAIPGYDLYADYRDCEARTGDGWDLIDCGGMVVTVVGYVAVITGALAAPTTGGGSLSISAVGIRIDKYEDVLDAGDTVARFLKHNKTQVGPVSRLVNEVFGRERIRILLTRVPDRYKPKIARLHPDDFPSYRVYHLRRDVKLGPSYHGDLTPAQIQGVMDGFDDYFEFWLKSGKSLDEAGNAVADIKVYFWWKQVPDTNEFQYARAKDTLLVPGVEHGEILIDGGRQASRDEVLRRIGKTAGYPDMPPEEVYQTFRGDQLGRRVFGAVGSEPTEE